MKRVIDFFRFSLISPETVWIGIVLIGYFNFSEQLIFFGKQFKSNSDLWRVLSGLPFAFLVSIFKSTGDLRSPLDKAENKILYEWPAYNKITDRAIYSLILSVLCCLGVILLWLYSIKLPEELFGALYLIFAVIPGISAFSLILSVQKIKEILTKNL